MLSYAVMRDLQMVHLNPLHVLFLLDKMNLSVATNQNAATLYPDVLIHVFVCPRFGLRVVPQLYIALLSIQNNNTQQSILHQLQHASFLMSTLNFFLLSTAEFFWR